MQVFERSTYSPNRGAGVAIYPNGHTAMHAIDPQLPALMWQKARQAPCVTQIVDAKGELSEDAVTRKLAEDGTSALYRKVAQPNGQSLVRQGCQPRREHTVTHLRIPLISRRL